MKSASVLQCVLMAGGLLVWGRGAAVARAEPPLPSWRLSERIIVADAALYLPDARWGTSVNGRSFQQSAIASHSGWQYAVFYDAERRLCLSRRAWDRLHPETLAFNDFRFQGNDTHNAPVLGLCPADGTIHLAYDHHGHPLHYRVSRPGVARNPERFAWGQELFHPQTDELEPGRPVRRVTYPRFWSDPDGNLQFQCRIGGSGNGAAWLADYRAGRWNDFGPIISGEGAYDSSSSRNAYENGYAYGGDGRLHVSWCWRETGDPMTNHDLAYAFSEDRGRTWKNDRGAVVGQRGQQLMSIETAGLTVVEIPMRRGQTNSMAQAVDSQGRLHVVTRHLPDDVPDQPDWNETKRQSRFFHYWRAGPGDWRRTVLRFSGNRGQLAFDRHDNGVYLYVDDDDQSFCLAVATAANEWSDWIVALRVPGCTDQPLLDLQRLAAEGVLSVFVQAAPENPRASSSPLWVLDFEQPEPESAPEAAR